MARASGQGRAWARTLSTTLFGLAVVDLTGAFGIPGIQLSLVPEAFGPIIPVLTWLAGLAAVWMLWRPASSAYFSTRSTRTRQEAQIAELARLRSSRARLPRRL